MHYRSLWSCTGIAGLGDYIEARSSACYQVSKKLAAKINNASPAFCRIDRNFDAGVVQKQPGTSIEVMRGPRRVCSSVKSWRKVSLLPDGFSNFISEGLALSPWHAGLYDCRLLLALAAKRFVTTHFLARLIATPVVWLSTWKLLV
jgi:hypothetical protein